MNLVQKNLIKYTDLLDGTLNLWDVMILNSVMEYQDKINEIVQAQQAIKQVSQKALHYKR